MNRAPKFTIWHGLAASLALHSVLALPFVMHHFAPPPDDLPVLVVELQGAVADRQADERVAQQMPEQTRQQQPQATAPPPQEVPPQRVPPRQSPPQPQEGDGPKPPEVQPQLSSPQQPVSSETRQAPFPAEQQILDEQQKPQTLETDRDLLNEYVKRLSKKVQANLVYPAEGLGTGLQGNAKVSFTISGDGQIKPGTLMLVASSGQPKLDASALATARSCAPFDPPPREITIAIDVRYGRKR